MKKKKDSTPVYIAALSLAIVVVVLVLAVAARTSKPGTVAPLGTQQAVMSGVQTATITIVPANGEVPTQQTTTVKINNSAVGMTASVPANGRVSYKIDHFKKLALQPLEFQVFDQNKKAYTPDDLKIFNDAKMHYIVLSANLKEYQHLYPTFDNGKWKVLANLPNPGTYYAYVAISPVIGDPVVLRTSLIVQNETNGTVTYPGLTPNLIAITGGYIATMTLSQPVVLQQSILSYLLTKDGAPVTDLQPLLGSFGSVVIFRQGSVDSFMQIHPLSSTDPKKGLAEFTATFTTGGRYTAIAEFKFGKKTYTFPITFDIKG